MDIKIKDMHKGMLIMNSKRRIYLVNKDAEIVKASWQVSVKDTDKTNINLYDKDGPFWDYKQYRISE